MNAVCKKSKDCGSGDVCDVKLHVCRESHRRVGVSKAELAKQCLKRGIPINYERGPHKGERKTKQAMQHCKTQKDRNVVAYDRLKVKALPAPSVKAVPAASAAATASPFDRPSQNDLRNMNKAQLIAIYKSGQMKGYIDPTKTESEMTNKQLVNAIVRATKKKY